MNNILRFCFIPLMCCLIQLSMTAQAPAGYTCSNPIQVDGCNQTFTGTTVGVPNDNSTSGATNCTGSVGTSGQMWYSFTATANASMTVSTCGSPYDTQIAVYTGTCGNLTCIGGNDDGCGLQSTLTFTTTEGQSYLLRVGGFASQSGVYTLQMICADGIVGCTNPQSSNYNPQATVDNGSCIIFGCTDSTANNYNASATSNDGSCNYCTNPAAVQAQLYVCTFSNGANVNLTIVDAAGNVVQEVANLGNVAIQYFNLCLLPGECYTAYMTNAAGDLGWYGGYFRVTVAGVQLINESLNANLVNETAFFSVDGTCASVPGCTDATAINYNAAANVEDGSCLYNTPCDGGSTILLTMNPVGFPTECSYEIVNADGLVVVSGGNFSTSTSINSTACLTDGCYTVVMHDSFGDGWNGSNLLVNANGVTSTFTFSSGSVGAGAFGVNASECSPSVASGCTQPAADNYDATALVDDGSCVYTGCMDQTALNFDPQATMDDGSCTYCNGPGSVIAPLYICTFSNGAQVELVITDDQGNEIYYASGLGNSSIINAQLCLNPGVCYTATMINNAGPFGWYNGYFWIHVNGAEIIHTGLQDGLQFASVQFSIDGTCGPIPGCMDPNALNYNPEATLNDGSCAYPVSGCTDPAAANYNQAATLDNGSCIYADDCTGTFVVFTLTPGIFTNEASYFVTDQAGNTVAYGSASNLVSYACMADGCYTLHMYDSFGDGWDGGGYLTVDMGDSSVFVYTLDFGLNYSAMGLGVNSEGCVFEILGCTDAAASNYNPTANTDDGSCVYPPSCDMNLITLTTLTANWGTEVSWQLLDASDSLVAQSAPMTSNSVFTQYACVPDGCYHVIMNDSWGDGWNGGYMEINVNGVYSTYGYVSYGSTASVDFAINGTCDQLAGCTDATAWNYNPAATYDDGSCMYNQGWAPQGIGLGLGLDFTLYPNPTNSGMNINFNHLNERELLQVQLMTADGRLLRSEQWTAGSTSFQVHWDLEDIAAGYYIVRMIHGDEQISTPLVKQ